MGLDTIIKLKKKLYYEQTTRRIEGNSYRIRKESKRENKEITGPPRIRKGRGGF